MTKSFNPLELVARVKSQIRRFTKLGSTAGVKENEAVYSTGGLVINDDQKMVTVDGEPIKLTPIEYNILLLLVKNQGRFFQSNRFMKVSGMRRLWVRIIRSRYISVISVKRLRLIQRIQDI